MYRLVDMLIYNNSSSCALCSPVWLKLTDASPTLLLSHLKKGFPYLNSSCERQSRWIYRTSHPCVMLTEHASVYVDTCFKN